MRGLTDHVKTDDGMVFIRYAVVADVHLLRRDDLRGCWEVNGDIYATRAEAYDAAEAALDAATKGLEWITTVSGNSPPEHPPEPHLHESPPVAPPVPGDPAYRVS